MTKKILMLFSALLTINAFAASPPDVHFKNSNQFIKNELIQAYGKTYVRLSGCMIHSSGKYADCTYLAAIEKSEFQKMRTCTNRMMAAGFLSFWVSVPAAILGGAVTGGPGAAPGVALGLSGIYKSNQADWQSGVFSEQNESDTDYIYQYSYDTFVNALMDSLESDWKTCDVAGHLLRVREDSYRIKL